MPAGPSQMELFVSLEVAPAPLFGLDHFGGQARCAALSLRDDRVVALGLRAQRRVAHDAAPKGNKNPKSYILCRLKVNSFFKKNTSGKK